MIQPSSIESEWRECPASGFWSFTSQRTSYGPLTPPLVKKAQQLPEDAEERWTDPTTAGDLLLLHHREHPNVLHHRVVSQLIGKLFSGSTPAHRRSLGHSSQLWRTSAAQAASGKLPVYPTQPCRRVFELLPSGRLLRLHLQTEK